MGDNYAGLTFRRDFEDLGIAYTVSWQTKGDIYDAFEPRLNAGEVELLDHPKLQEQLLTLVLRSGRIDHQAGDHDDYANAACGSLVLASNSLSQMKFHPPVVHSVPRNFDNPSPGAGFGWIMGGDQTAPPGGWPANHPMASANAGFSTMAWSPRARR